MLTPVTISPGVIAEQPARMVPPRPVIPEIVFPGDMDTPHPIPEVLRNLEKWVLWRYELRQSSKGLLWTKPPFAALSGQFASSTNPTTWTDFETAFCVYCERLPYYDGIGFVLAGDGLVGIDLDHCRSTRTGELKPWAQEVLRGFPGAYAEVSPSGTGVHLIYRGNAPRTGKRYVDELDENGERGAFEAYTSGRYLTVTGAPV